MDLLSGLFRMSAERRSLENPSTPLSAPDDWLFDSMGSFRASSGVNVNRETALTNDVYWRCVSLLSGDVGKTPLFCQAKQNVGKGQGTTWIHDHNHPAYKLVHYQWNDEIAALHGKRVLTLHAIAEGNGYAYIFRDGFGQPLELWPLSPMKTYPVRENGRLLYVTEVGREMRKLPAADVFHLKGLSFDGMVGYSAVAKMRECIGLALAYENYGSIFFRNQAMPKVVLKVPGKLKPEAKTNLRESWERMHSGLENSHRTAVLEDGVDIKDFVVRARDAQLLEEKGFSRDQICNFFGVPSHKASSSAKSSYNSLEQENEEYLVDGGGLGFWLANWESECWLKLLTEEEKAERSHRFTFDAKRLRRATLQIRTQYYNTMYTIGALCPDEIREEEGLNPRPDGKGGEYASQLNMSTGGNLPGPADSKKPKDLLPKPGDKGNGGKGKKGKRDSPRALPAPARLALPAPDPLYCQRAVIEDVAARMLTRLRHAAERAAKKPAEFTVWLDALEEEQARTLVEAFQPVATAIGAVAGRALAPEVLAGELLDRVRWDLSRVAGEATAKTLGAAVDALAWSECSSAFGLSVCSRKADQPYRSQLDALALLAAQPDKGPDGRIACLFPYRTPAHAMDSTKLKAYWEKGKVKKRIVRIRALIAGQRYLRREDVAGFLKDPHYPNDKQNIAGSRDDYPYVVQVKEPTASTLWVYDGHHRLSARYLQGVGKTVVYLVNWKG